MILPSDETPGQIVSDAKNARIQPRRILLPLMVVGLLSIAGIFAFRGAGRWLIREDPLAKADLIVVLSGSMPYRAEEAATIYRMGYAPEVWVSRPENPEADLRELGIDYIGEEEYNRDVLIHEGVPKAAVHIFPETISNTEQEVREVSRVMQQAQKTSVIFVTSPQHTRRVRKLWLALVGRNPAAIVHAARQDPFDANHWWRNTRDALSVAREFLGLLNVWVGFPVKPHAR